MNIGLFADYIAVQRDRSLLAISIESFIDRLCFEQINYGKVD
jgi:hypothetical protein